MPGPPLGSLSCLALPLPTRNNNRRRRIQLSLAEFGPEPCLPDALADQNKEKAHVHAPRLTLPKRLPANAQIRSKGAGPHRQGCTHKAQRQNAPATPLGGVTSSHMLFLPTESQCWLLSITPPPRVGTSAQAQCALFPQSICYRLHSHRDSSCQILVAGREASRQAGDGRCMWAISPTPLPVTSPQSKE